jgi:hypothetical protein
VGRRPTLTNLRFQSTQGCSTRGNCLKGIKPACTTGGPLFITLDYLIEHQFPLRMKIVPGKGYNSKETTADFYVCQYLSFISEIWLEDGR